MAAVRRTRHVSFSLEDGPWLDITPLLAGDVPRMRDGTRVVAHALLTGARHPLERTEFDVLMSVPVDGWVDADSRHATLVDKALLISDDGDPRLAALRRRDEALSAGAWQDDAVAYHLMTRWGGVDIRQGLEPELGPASRAVAQDYVAEHGPPPAPFREPWRGAPTVSLPRGARDGAFYRVLAARRTTRTFDQRRAMTIDEFGSVLHHVFGCHGYATTIAGTVCIKRTSPSAGALHPIEAYPLVSAVTGLAAGIYHYHPGRHELALLSELDPGAARVTATSLMCGQSYFGAAHVSFLLTARFSRSHWKYRRHPKAYAGALMDAAHLSQTLYLVCAEMGLGAFVTLAINSRDIDDRLGIDGVSEGAVAVIGCGWPAPVRSPLELDFAREDAAQAGAGHSAEAG